MATLHLINKSGQPFNLCQRALAQGDGVLLIEDGVYLLQSEHKTLKEVTDSVSCYYLETDASARGIQPKELSIAPASYETFVQLTTQYDKVVSWF